ncbi:MAG: septation regulator SpoVG [Tissierellia bacterium]|nr:septation regulator SpoVG [Tissierellia bacterium]
MNITDVRVRYIANQNKMKAVVSVTFDDMFVVHDIKVIEGQNGVFIAMPSRRVGEGDFRDIAHPINAAARAILQDAILKAYEESKPEEFEATEEAEATEEVVEEE